MKDSKSYQEKKGFFDTLLTLYGRNVVDEVLADESLQIYKLHLAKSNKQDGIVKQIVSKAKQRNIEIVYHDKKALSRISKNARQDQGVAIDIIAPLHMEATKLKSHLGESYRVLALDGVQNPQNLGMIIRSAVAGHIDAIILPRHNSAKLSPLVMKASAGTLFKIPIVYCKTLEDVLDTFDGADIYALSSHAKENIYAANLKAKTVFVLGNESEGVSKTVMKYCNNAVSIPMQRGVESLNVAVTASLLAFMKS